MLRVNVLLNTVSKLNLENIIIIMIYWNNI
jgi:hypothetical protein